MRQLTLYCQEGSYGFGMRVVGQPTDTPVSARVLYIAPGGPAHCAGIRVGDRIVEWDGLPLSSVAVDHIPELIEQCDSRMVTLVLRYINNYIYLYMGPKGDIFHFAREIKRKSVQYRT